ncbi:MAG TPA: hypothetical protein VJJ21_03840 [Candidatus Nanoarchaeia archaeon]|nr:hypothetical protein [Candidatus Nanoarchaeia archaeon]
MNKHYPILIIIVLLIPIAAAITPTQPISEIEREQAEARQVIQLEQLKQYEDQQVPGIAQKLLSANERINLNIDDSKLNIILEDYIVKSIQQGSIDDNTIEIITSQSAINSLLSSEDTKTAAKELIARKEIQIKTKSFFKKIKFSIAKFLLKFA